MLVQADDTNSCESTSICCIGAGYVGGPTGAVIANACPKMKVFVADVNPARIAEWNSTKMPFYEPGLYDLVCKTRERNLFFTTDLKMAISESDIILVCVNTPTKSYGIGAGKSSDLTYFESAIRTIAKYASGYKIIVEKSTVPCKTAELIDKILKENAPSLQYEVLSNPEFMAEGTAIKDLMFPDRVLIGGIPSDRGFSAMETLSRVYSNWIPHEKIIAINLWSSEISKLAANAFLAQRVSSINAISALCEKVGANVDEVSMAVGADSRIGSKYLKASLGFGGSCFQKDILNLVYLCESFGLNEVAEYWHQIIKINEYQKKRSIQKIISKLNGTAKLKTIAIFGFAFKNNTGDTRESAAIKMVKELADEQGRINIYDPKATESAIMEELHNVACITKHIKIFSNAYEACKNADCIVVCTDWEEFRTLNYAAIYESMQRPAYVFDGRSCIDIGNLKKIGFEADAIGK